MTLISSLQSFLGKPRKESVSLSDVNVFFNFSISFLAAPPKKPPVPSLGVGDPENLARKLQDILFLISDEENSPSETQPKPSSRKTVPRKPQFSSEPISQKKVVTTLDENTPRKFFKSKTPFQTPSGKVSSVKKSEEFKTPARAPDQNTPRKFFRSKTPFQTPSGKVSSEELKTPARSVATVKFDVYDEFQLETPTGKKKPSPAPTTGRRGRVKQRAVSSSEEEEEEEFKTPLRYRGSVMTPGSGARSVKKPSREDQNQENLGLSDKKVTEKGSEEVKKSSRKKKSDLEPPKLATRNSTRFRQT